MTFAETWNNPRSSKQDCIGEAFREDDADSDPSVVINDLFPYLSNQSRLDFIMTGEPHYCYAIAQIGNLSADVCAALSEMADEAGGIRLAENHAAPIPTFSLIRLLERFPRSERLFQALEARSELDFAVWQALATSRIELALSRCRHTPTTDDIERGEADVLVQAPSSALPYYCHHLLMMNQGTVTLLVRTIVSGQIQVFCEMLSQIAGYSSDLVEYVIYPFRRDEFLELANAAGLRHEQARFITTALEVWSNAELSGVRLANGPNLDCVSRLQRILAFSDFRTDPELRRFLSRLRLEAETGEPFPVRAEYEPHQNAGDTVEANQIHGRFAA